MKFSIFSVVVTFCILSDLFSLVFSFCRSAQNIYCFQHTLFLEIIRHWGYPAEEFEVVTEDGYILSINRIPHGVKNNDGQGKGLSCAQDRLNDSRVELFQQFLWQVKLPQLAKEVQPLLGLFNNLVHVIVPLHDLFGRKDFFPQNDLIKFFATEFCSRKPLSVLCGNIFFLLCGFDEKNLNMSRTPVYTTHCPAGTSVQNMVHWAQAVKSSKLMAYDYGKAGNMAHYNQSTPPLYNVRDMTVPTALWSGGQDTLADPQDVALLLTQIPKLVYHRNIKHWEHLDFIWGLDAPQEMYNKLIKMMKENV
uniref:Lipase, gastric n=1 Tax=Cyprinus carpio TaxID=7962 RepID=A0A8C2G8G9_CYPCA